MAGERGLSQIRKKYSDGTQIVADHNHPRKSAQLSAAIRVSCIVLVVLVLCLGPAREARAANLFAGIGDILYGVVSLPLGILDGTLRGPFILGTIGGVLRGAINTIGFTVRGVFELIGVAIPLAARAAPYIPIFL